MTLVAQLSNMVDQLQNHDPRMQAGTLNTSDQQWINTLHQISDRMSVSCSPL